MCYYYYYQMSPPEGEHFLPVDEVLARVAKEFPRHEFDPTAAREDAARVIAVMTRLGAPEKEIASYGGNPVRCRIFDAEVDEHLQFDVREDQGLMITVHPDDVINSCLPLVERLAKLLGYHFTQDTYD